MDLFSRKSIEVNVKCALKAGIKGGSQLVFQGWVEI
jgi:hypothetical protein